MVEANIDQVMLKNMISPEELAMYSAALKIVVGLSFVPMVLKSSFFPSIVAAKNKNKELYEKKLMQFYQIMMMVFLCIAFPLIILGKPIIYFVYGEEYSAAGPLLQLMATRLFFTNYGLARSNFIINENLMKHYFITMLIGAVVSVVLNLIYIPMLGSIGAIIVSMIVFFVTIFLIDLFYPKTRKNSLMMFKSMFNFYKLFLK
jgi:O-antigen/teichoic acid export membrane protein